MIPCAHLSYSDFKLQNARHWASSDRQKSDDERTKSIHSVLLNFIANKTTMGNKWCYSLIHVCLTLFGEHYIVRSFVRLSFSLFENRLDCCLIICLVGWMVSSLFDYLLLLMTVFLHSILDSFFQFPILGFIVSSESKSNLINISFNR